MTTEEFSNEFDTLVDAYSQQGLYGAQQDPPQFNEYEKSVFLTRAQEQLVIAYYTTALGQDSFETTEELRRYLDALVTTDTITKTSQTPPSIIDSYKHFVYNLPTKLWFIVYEQARYVDTDKCINGFMAEIIPITHDAYYRTTQNPFRGPSRKRVLRLDSGKHTVELVSKYNIDSYILRYIAKPSPIILSELKDLTINDESKPQTCSLNSNIHRKILELGVQLALQSRVKETNNNTKD